MRRRLAESIWLLVVSFAMIAPALYAQTSDESKSEVSSTAPDKNTTRVTLGSSSGEAGTSIVVPIYFTPAAGASVGHIKLAVTWVSVNMKFDKVERGIAAEMGDVTLKSDISIGKNEQGIETSTLAIEASQESPKKPIPSGLLGYISMKVNENGRAAKVALHGTVEASDSSANAPLKNVKVLDSIVEIFAPGTQPAVACFFFSH